MIIRKQKLTADSMSAILRRVMSERKISQADLVRLAGVNKATVSQWYNGNVVISDRSRQRLAEVLGCEYDLLTYGQTTTSTEQRTTTATNHAIAITGQVSQVGSIEVHSAPADQVAPGTPVIPDEQEAALLSALRAIPEPFRRPYLDKILHQVERYRQAVDGD